MTVGTTARRGIDGLASVLRIVGMLIVLVLVLHIVLTLLDANPANTIATMINQLADTFNLGLSNLFLPPTPSSARAQLRHGRPGLVRDHERRGAHRAPHPLSLSIWLRPRTAEHPA